MSSENSLLLLAYAIGAVLLLLVGAQAIRKKMADRAWKSSTSDDQRAAARTQLLRAAYEAGGREARPLRLTRFRAAAHLGPRFETVLESAVAGGYIMTEAGTRQFLDPKDADTPPNYRLTQAGLREIRDVTAGKREVVREIDPFTGGVVVHGDGNAVAVGTNIGQQTQSHTVGQDAALPSLLTSLRRHVETEEDAQTIASFVSGSAASGQDPSTTITSAKRLAQKLAQGALTTTATAAIGAAVNAYLNQR